MISRRWAAPALLCAALLTGCSGGSDSDGSSPPPDAGTPLQTQSADGLPAEFPRDQVPIIDGEVTSVEEGGSDQPGYAVAVVIDTAETEAMSQAVDLLEGAGWKKFSSGNGGRVQVLRQGSDQIIVTSAPTNGQTLITYTTTVAASS